MILYNALSRRSTRYADLTDELPAVAHLTRTIAMGVGRWARENEADPVSANVGAHLFSAREFVVDLRAKGDHHWYRGLVLTEFELAKMFLAENPNSIEVLNAAALWYLTWCKTWRRLEIPERQIVPFWFSGSSGEIVLSIV